MAFLLHGSFHVSSKYHCLWKTCHILNKQMVSLLCGFFHVSSKYHFLWKTCHTLNKQMVSLLCGFFHVSSKYHCLWKTCHTLNKQMVLSCVGSFMFLQAGNIIESLATLRARKLLLSGVGPHGGMPSRIFFLMPCHTSEHWIEFFCPCNLVTRII